MTAIARRIPEIDLQWEGVRQRMREIVGNDAFMSWVNPIGLEGADGGEITLSVQNRFVRDWLTSHYLPTLIALWQEADPDIETVRLAVSAADTPPEAAAVQTAAAPGRPTESPAPAAPPAMPAAEASLGADADLTAISIPLDPRFTFDKFITGKPNELAFAAAQRVATSPSGAFNPLFLYGGVGLGKTHLLQAIAWQLHNSQPERRVLHLSAEKFMYQFISALRFRDVMSFKELFRSVDVLLVDDVQFMADKDNTQEEFFHTFNALVEQRKQIVVSGDKSPTEIGGIKERLRSRLSSGLAVDIHPTTYELRVGILQAKAEAAQVPVPQAVVEFLAHKISSNVRELEGALNRLIAHAELVARPISVDGAIDLLSDLIRANDRQPTIDEIQRKTAEHFGIRLTDLLSHRRTRHLVRPRHTAMYLCKILTTRSYPEIALRFGKRDHTTVMHAVKRMEALYAADLAFREEIETLRRLLTR